MSTRVISAKFNLHFEFWQKRSIENNKMRKKVQAVIVSSLSFSLFLSLTFALKLFFYVGSIIKFYTYNSSKFVFWGELSMANAGVGVALTQLLYMCVRIALCVPCAAELIHLYQTDTHTHALRRTKQVWALGECEKQSKQASEIMYIYTYFRIHIEFCMYTYICTHMYICSYIRTQSAYLVYSKLPIPAHCETRSNAVICSVGGSADDNDSEFGNS